MRNKNMVDFIEQGIAYFRQNTGKEPTTIRLGKNELMQLALECKELLCNRYGSSACSQIMGLRIEELNTQSAFVLF